MESDVQNLKGSKTNDDYRYMRKQKLSNNGKFCGADMDYVCTSKNPAGIVAIFDIKHSTFEPITFSEALAYNSMVRKTRVYILVAYDLEVGMFGIYRYYGADWHPDPPAVDKRYIKVTRDWKEYEDWERGLREKYEKDGGWKHLKTSEIFAEYIC